MQFFLLLNSHQKLFILKRGVFTAADNSSLKTAEKRALHLFIIFVVTLLVWCGFHTHAQAPTPARTPLPAPVPDTQTEPHPAYG